MQKYPHDCLALLKMCLWLQLAMDYDFHFTGYKTTVDFTLRVLQHSASLF